MTQQIELTSKKWKGLKVWSLVIMFIVAPILYGNNISLCGVAFFIGIVMYFYSRIGAWWNHG